MGILGRAQGVFDLKDSDRAVGSFLKIEDVCEVLKVSADDLSNIKFKTIDGLKIVDERVIQKAWYGNLIPRAIPVEKSSLDELLLIALIRNTLPNVRIERQLKIGRFALDLKLSNGNTEIFVEFDGPYHFAPSRYGLPKDPFRKKRTVEDATGIECVNWPYWIQRCSSNILALFDRSISGLGVLWSTNVHFGMFSIDNPAEVIETITARFNAVDMDGYGYFYGPESRNRNNPEHPIVEKIALGKESIEVLIPKGSSDRDRWIPQRASIKAL